MFRFRQQARSGTRNRTLTHPGPHLMTCRGIRVRHAHALPRQILSKQTSKWEMETKHGLCWERQTGVQRQARTSVHFQYSTKDTGHHLGGKIVPEGPFPPVCTFPSSSAAQLNVPMKSSLSSCFCTVLQSSNINKNLELQTQINLTGCRIFKNNKRGKMSYWLLGNIRAKLFLALQELSPHLYKPKSQSA